VHPGECRRFRHRAPRAGHNYYQRAYNKQPYLYLDSANDGFHEAIGDMIALSVTPEYLVQTGLLKKNQLPTPSRTGSCC
jgi:peptidyl-dipeptidase A